MYQAGMVDIVMTTRNRKQLLERSLNSLFANTTVPFRLWIHDDASEDETPRYLLGLQSKGLLYLVLSKKRVGVVAGFNMLWNMVDYYDLFWEEMPYMCYLQDDIEITERDWLQTCLRAYERFEPEHGVGFFTGYDAPEHPVAGTVDWEGRLLLLKRSSTATNLIATKQFWRSIGWVPRRNPDGSERGFPHKNRGSHIDLYLTGCMSGSKFVHKAAAAYCSYKQGKTLLVVPGLIRHTGDHPHRSTWRVR